MTTLEQEIYIQRDTGLRNPADMLATQLEDIASAIREHSTHYEAEEEAEVLERDAQTIRNPDEIDWMMWADDTLTVAEMALEELTGMHAVNIPENSAWLIVTPAGLDLLSEEEN